MPGSTASNREALILAGAARSALGDALATRNPLLVPPEGAWAKRGNPTTPEEAVALLGLYLRLRGDFTYEHGGDRRRDEVHSVAFDRGLYYWVLTRALLPAGWRWFNACVQSELATGDDTPVGLGGSAITRIERALRARDRVHEQFKIPQDANTMDEAHFYLDVVLLQLGGALDAVARVAHLAYGLSGGYDYASWRRKEWRKRLSSKAPVLATMTEETRATRDVIEIIALLRNTIHGEALEGVTLRRSAASYQAFRVPSRESHAFVSAAKRRGGLARWGITSLGGTEYLVAADRLVEALVPDAARALNRLMRATDVAGLPGVQGVRLRSRPPEGRDSVFNRWTRQRLRLLAGL